jgi:hypothetical protein
VGLHPRWDRSISTWNGTVALTTPVNTSPSRYLLLAESLLTADHVLLDLHRDFIVDASR